MKLSILNEENYDAMKVNGRPLKAGPYYAWPREFPYPIKNAPLKGPEAGTETNKIVDNQTLPGDPDGEPVDPIEQVTALVKNDASNPLAVRRI